MIQRLHPAVTVLALLSVGAGPVRVCRAAEFVVDSTVDAPDANPGDGLCADAGGRCTLRSAISETNALLGEDTVIVPAGFYPVTLFTPFADLIIQDDLRIVGAGPSETVLDGGSENRVFVVSVGRTVEMSGLRIQNGHAANGGIHGGAIANSGALTLRRSAVVGNTAVGSGGGIYSILGSLALIDCTVSLNAADACGGGVFNGAFLTVDGTTIANNQVGDGADCGGGGVYSQFDAIFINSTVSGNGATRDGGGIQNVGGALSLTNVTVALNTADADSDGVGDGGGVFSNVAVQIENSILSANIDTGNEGADCWATLTSLGYNLVSADGGCLIGGDLTGVIVGQSALLAPLADQGGSTQVHALLIGSPAVDAGSPAGFPGADQRGFARPMDGDGDGIAFSDMGAFELADPDCNDNGTPDATDIADGDSADCNENGFPDECDIAFGMSGDCNTNTIPDDCDVADGTSPDQDADGLPDECELPGDFDLDGDVDLFDYVTFFSCVTGPDGGILPGCAGADADGDADVDQPDFGAFQIAFTGGN